MSADGDDAPPSSFLRSPDRTTRPPTASSAGDFAALAAARAEETREAATAAPTGAAADVEAASDGGERYGGDVDLTWGGEEGGVEGGSGGGDGGADVAAGAPPAGAPAPPAPDPAPAEDEDNDATLEQAGDDDVDGEESVAALPTTTHPPHTPPPSSFWADAPRHLLVTTTAGKPVLVVGGGDGDRDGDGRAAGLAATGAALADYAEEAGDGVVSMSFPPSHTLLFARHGHLRFLVSSRLGEPAAALAARAAGAHAALVALATSALHAALARDAAFDAGRLLGGADAGAVVAAVLGDDDARPLALTAAFPPLPLPARARTAASAALADAAAAAGAVCGALFRGGDVVALAGGWEAVDVVAAAAVVAAAVTGDGREAFLPVCLPASKPASFLHAYAAAVDGADGLALALLLPSPAAFDAAHAAATDAADALRTSGVVEAVASARSPSVAAVRAAVGAAASPLLHFAARSAARRQLLSCPASPPPPPGGLARARCALLGGAAPVGMAGVAVETGVAAATRSTPPGTAARPPVRCYWESGGSDGAAPSLLALRSAEYELYVTVAPGTPVAAAAAAARAVGGWVRARAGDLFVPVATSTA